jgi:hypothetical protein
MLTSETRGENFEFVKQTKETAENYINARRMDNRRNFGEKAKYH